MTYSTKVVQKKFATITCKTKMKFNQIAKSSAAALLSTSVACPTYAFQPLATLSHHFITSRGIATRSHLHAPLHHDDAFPHSHIPQRQNYQFHPTRLYGSKKEGEKKSFLEQAADKVKSILPFSKSKSQMTKKEEAKQDVSTAIDTMLKDAPLGVRMFGKMMKPMVGSLVGGMAQAMEDQQRQMSDLLSDARNYIVQDPNAVQLLGEPVEIGSPFSQSSSTMSVNGQTRTNLQASFEVRGGRGVGVASISSVDGRIENLTLNVGGRNIRVDVTKSGSYNSADVSWDSGMKSGGTGKTGKKFKDEDVIDVEFVEKK